MRSYEDGLGACGIYMSDKHLPTARSVDEHSRTHCFANSLLVLGMGMRARLGIFLPK